MRMAVSKKTARIIAAGLFALTLLFALAPTALAAVYWGQSGETVRRVQQKLKQWGYYTGAVDGVFGQSTYDVIQFQKKNGLTADGVAGTATLAAMGISETTAASAVTTAASGYASEVELLARRTLCRHGGGWRSGAQPGEKQPIPQYDGGRDLSIRRVRRGERWTDQPCAQRAEPTRRTGRDERLGSDGRLSVLL